MLHLFAANTQISGELSSLLFTAALDARLLEITSIAYALKDALTI
jgi:hypothetical protein